MQVCALTPVQNPRHARSDPLWAKGRLPNRVNLSPNYQHILDLPNLIAVQTESFEWFKNQGLKETIEDINPIEDYTGNYAVEFGDYQFNEPALSLKECRDKDQTYAAPLFITVRFVNRESGEIREQNVFMGDFPMMTEQGTFIINGTERVIVTQLVRSPGAYVMAAKDPTKQVLIANLMPARGSWLEFEIDKRGAVSVRIDRKRKLPATVFLRALAGIDSERTRDDPDFLSKGTDEEILDLFDGNPFIKATLDKDSVRSVEEALVELFKKQRPGEPPTLEASRNLLWNICFDPKRYDLTRVGRHKLNARLGLDTDLDVRTLTKADIVALVRELVAVPLAIDHEHLLEEARDLAEVAPSLPWDEVANRLDEYEHFGNRRLRMVGELVQEAFRVGLYRMERVVRERMTTEDVDTITPQSIINIRPVVAALKEFFGSSQLSQFMDQTNSLAGLTHRRRLSALGAGGLTRERAPIEVRDVHPTHYGRMCPIETPEGPNIGLIGSLSSYATVNEFGFIQTPYRKVVNGKVTDEIEWLTAYQEEKHTIAQANAPVDPKTDEFVEDTVLARAPGGEYVSVRREDVDYMDVSPQQIVSVATALMPFLEHNDANRALMGSNMQRQAVPLLEAEAPLIGTGMEYRSAVDTGDVLLAKQAGKVRGVSADRILIETDDGDIESYDLLKFERSNQGTFIHQKPVVDVGDEVSAGHGPGRRRLHQGRRAGAGPQPARGLHELGGLQLRRLHRHQRTAGQGRRPHLGAHRGVRGRSPVHQAGRRRDHPRHPQPLGGVAGRPRRGRHRAHRRRGVLGRPAGGQDHPQGRDRADGRRETHPGHLQREGPRGARHLAQGAARREGRRHRRQGVLPRGRRRPVPGRQPPGAGLRGQEAQDRRGRQAGRPPRQQRGHLQDRPRRGHAVPGRRHAGRHHPQPAGRAFAYEHRAGHGDPPGLGRSPRLLPAQAQQTSMDGDVRRRATICRPPSRSTLVKQVLRHRRRLHGRRARCPSPPRCSTAPPRSTSTRPSWAGWSLRRIACSVARRQPGLEPNLAVKMPISLDNNPGTRVAGKVKLYNGRTGEPYDQSITVGYMYMLKLHHLVDDKIHARSTGPYSLVTQQPLGGKAQFGGQRFGEMEVWALEAYGAAYTLQEMLTIKSDDTQGRVKAYEAIVKGENIARPGVPESFKVLLKEMQSLALDIQVMSEEGGALEVGEEEDDLLRAAEELGIDLSARYRAEERAARRLQGDIVPTDTGPVR